MSSLLGLPPSLLSLSLLPSLHPHPVLVSSLPHLSSNFSDQTELLPRFKPGLGKRRAAKPLYISEEGWNFLFLSRLALTFSKLLTLQFSFIFIYHFSYACVNTVKQFGKGQLDQSSMLRTLPCLCIRVFQCLSHEWSSDWVFHSYLPTFSHTRESIPPSLV